MTQYSFAGYLSALEMRLSKTILVEGVTDHQIFSRVINGLIESGELASDSVVLDFADLIDRTGYLMGVREFVEHVHASSTASVDQFFVLVDREFRGFDLGPPPIDRLAGHHMPAPNLMWTRGHSIENYMFSVEAMLEYLRIHHPETVPVSTYGLVRKHFDAAVIWCGALTLALLEARLLGRADGLCKAEHWNHQNSCLDVTAFTTAIAPRCNRPFNSVHFEKRLHEWHSELSRCSTELSRWIAHGHIANSLLWVSIGGTLMAAGVEASTAELIATGMKANKFRVAASWWYVQITAKAPDSPLPLLQWLTG
jgi:hypothetical protein